MGRNKFSYLDIQNKIKEKFGYQPYIYLTKENEYENSINKIKVKCKKCGYIFESKPSELYNKNLSLPRCKNCNNKNKKENKINKKNFYFKFESYLKNLEILSPYLNYYTKMDFKCKKCNKEFSITPNNLKIKINKKIEICPYCYHDNKYYNEEKRKLEYEDYIKKLKEKDNYNYILKFNDFHNKSTKMKHICKICNYEFYATPTNVLVSKNHYCPNCNRKIRNKNNKNKIETKENNLNTTEKFQILLFLLSFYNKEIILNKDNNFIYLPNLNIAFSFTYLSDIYDRNYHYEKYKLCKDKGITLINIFEDEWKHKNNIVKNRIKYIMGHSDKPKVYARKCEVKEISSRQKDLFLERYHLQGKDNSSIKLGLIYENKIVSVMTFTKKRACLGNKNVDDNSYELCRFASSDNCIIIGAFSKLLTYFKRNYDYKEIVTYADLRWSNGNLYNKNGFKLDHISKPNYWYVYRNKGTKKYHRYQFRKSKLKSLFPDIYDDNLSESSIMEKANYYRIFDAGNLVFKLEK